MGLPYLLCDAKYKRGRFLRQGIRRGVSDNAAKQLVCIYSPESGELIEQFEGSKPRWSPDGQTIAAFARHESKKKAICLWDAPPRKSPTWFAAGAALLALSIALIARRRVRKLKSA
jgi:hypothetical protein